MKRLFLFTLLVSLFRVVAHGQEITQPFKDVVPPSPTVSSLMRFEEVPVNLYTGAPSISIPLFQKSIGSGMSIGLQLSYNTSGIRIDERSGWTGTGWSLMAGGTISRTVKDLPDEANSGTQKGTFHNGFFNYDNLTSIELDEFLWKTNAGGEKYDSQIDVFQFNFMGKTGRFSIVRNGTNQLEAKLVSRSEKMKIDFTADTDGVISDFTLTDARGYRYVFGTGGAYEITNSESMSTTKDNWGNTSQNNSNGAAIDSRSAWHLTSIRLPNDIELCNLKYQNVSESYNTPVNLKNNYPLTSLTGAYFDTSSEGSYNRGIILPKQISSFSNITVQSKKLHQINFRDSTDILIDLNAGHPELGGGSKLGKISLRDASDNLLQEYDFTYVTSTPGRLFLTNISHKANGESQDYTFHYDNLNDLPPFGSGKKDQWGYYNDENNESSFTQPHMANYADTIDVTTGVLTKIEYPTGGSQEFDYESNRFSFIGDQTLSPEMIPENSVSLNMNKVFTATAGTNSASSRRLIYVNHDHKAVLTQSGFALGSSVVIDNQKVRFDAVIKVSGTYSTDPSQNQIINLNDFQDDVNRPDPELNIVPVGNESKQNVNLSTGWYIISIVSSPEYIPEPGTTNISVNLELAFREYTILKKYMYGAGIRIKETRSVDAGNTLTSVKYLYEEPDTTGVSSGAFDGVILTDKTYEIRRRHMLAGNSLYQVHTFDYAVEEERNSLYSTADKTHFVGYRHVTKLQSGNGRTEFELSSPRDYPTFTNGYSFPFLQLEDQSYKTGLTLKEKVLNENGDSLLVKRNEYAYSSENVVKSLQIYHVQFSNCPYDRLYDDYDAYTAGTPEKGLLSGIIFTGLGTCLSPQNHLSDSVLWEVGTRADLIETMQTEYFPTQPGLSKESRQTFTYNSTNWQISSKHSFIKEGGDEYKYSNYFYYPDNYPSAYYNSAEQSTLASMLSANMYNELIATSSTKQQLGGGLTITPLNIVVNKYTGSGNTYRLSKYQVAQTPATASSLEDRVEVVSYDGFNNPLEVRPVDGASTAYAWGYGSTVPVIQVQNLSQADLQTAIQWAIANTSGLPPGTTTLQDVLDYVGDMSQPYQRTRWADFNAKLKEHPSLKYNQLTSMTYHPIYGMISQTAPDGMVMYYEYDSFGRLKYVKDQDGSILKMNEYAYQQTANTTGN